MSRRSYNPDIVKKENITAGIKPLNSSTEIRTSLRIPLNRGIASCILMNPSAADKDNSDETINFVTEYIYGNFPDIQRIRFFNLYPFYEGESSKIYKLMDNLTPLEYSESMKANRKAIKGTLSTTTHLFLGYGQCSGNKDDKIKYYNPETTEILEMIKDFYSKKIFVFETTQNEKILIKGKYPRHPNPNNEHKAINHHECFIDENGSIKLMD